MRGAEIGEGDVLRSAAIDEIVFLDIDAELARTEPDPEIQDLLKRSSGLNLALDYLPGSISFDPVPGRGAPFFSQ